MENRVAYNTANGAKPRFDNGGSEFGLMHRDLGPGFLMFDVDRMSAIVEIELELRRENEGFVEFRRNQNGIQFVAMFEIKHKRTPYSEDVLNPSNTNSMARLEMARRLGARLFIVFATDGQPPFDFYEIDTTTGEHRFAGKLNYSKSNRSDTCKEFWQTVLKVERYVS